MSSYLISQAQQLKLTAPVPATLHPAAVYLNSLAVGSRRAMLSSLNAIAELLTEGECDAYALDWSALRYHHTAAVVAAFRQRYAPATTNKAIAALRRVLTSTNRTLQAVTISRQNLVEPVKQHSTQTDTKYF